MAGTKQSGGQNRKSTTLHVLQGTFRKDRHADRLTPDPPAGRPVRPASVTGVARVEWDRMVARLEVSGTLASVDDAALYQYCQLFGETEALRQDDRRVRQLLRPLKRTLAGLQGGAFVEAVGKVLALEQQLTKHTTQLRQGHMAIRQYLVELGMTPSARTRVKVLAPTKDAAPTREDQLRAKFFGLPSGA